MSLSSKNDSSPKTKNIPSFKPKIKSSHQSQLMMPMLFSLFIMPLVIFLDSPWITPYFSYGQDSANVIMIGVYCWFLWTAKRKLYWLILIMTMSGFVAEVIGSFILELYQYRLHNIPLYVPPGHAVIYACIYHLANNPLIWRFHKLLERYLTNVAFITVCMSLFLLSDVGGLLGYLLFLFILSTRQKKLFYLGMFIIVYYNELCGTVCSTWAWYGVVGNHPNFPPIGYTSSGVVGLYMLFDLASNSVYYYGLKIFYFLFGSKHRSLYIEPAMNRTTD